MPTTAPAKVRSYIESRIDACGRVFAIKVYDTNRPFVVGRIVGNADEFEAIDSAVASRSAAIERCAQLALDWVRK